MAPNFIATICYYDGELVIDDQTCGKYNGGSYKPAKVRKGCNFEQLKASVYKATKIQSEFFDIDLVCNWPTDSGSKAIKIVDDDDVELMFSAVSKSIELFVVKTKKAGAETVVPEPLAPSLPHCPSQPIPTPSCSNPSYN